MLKSKLSGVSAPDILIPNRETDMEKWSIIACDQYTSELEYWNEAKKFVGASPSTLNMIFPEVYLEQGTEKQKTERIESINNTMDLYIKNGIFENLQNCMILTDRSIPGKTSRKGLVLAIDLEKYNFSNDSSSLIRATEQTVIERLPPRIRIRENASLELPHIMVLIDDPEKTIIEPLYDKRNEFEKLYDFNLMFDSGNIKGYRIDSKDIIENLFSAFDTLISPNTSPRDNAPSDLDPANNSIFNHDPLLFAVGDGNHSLASAKVCWEKIKLNLTEEEAENHPAPFVQKNDTQVVFKRGFVHDHVGIRIVELVGDLIPDLF